MGHDRVDDYSWGIYLISVLLLPEQGKDNWGEKLRDKTQLKKVTPSTNCQPL
jgi:hypothetical protein